MPTFVRYYLLQVLRTAALAFLILTALAMMGLSYQLHTRYPELLSPEFLLFVPSLLLEAFIFTVPLSLLAALAAVTSRFASDGEFDGWLMSGRAMHNLLQWAVLCSILPALLYFLMIGWVTPKASFLHRAYPKLMTREFDKVLDLIHDGRIRIRDYTFYFAKRDGRTIYDVIIASNRPGPVSTLRAKKAECSFNPDSNVLSMSVTSGSQMGYDRKNGLCTGARYFEKADFKLNFSGVFDAFSARPREVQLSTLSDISRDIESKLSIFPRTREKQLVLIRKFDAEFHGRISSAIGLVMLVVLGFSIGLAFRGRGLAEGVAAAIVIGAAVYWPLYKFAINLSETGSAPPWLLMQIPNLAVLAFAALFAWIAKRRAA